jgi:N utilization substance protein B
LNPDSSFEVESEFIRGRLHGDPCLIDFAVSLLRGVEAHRVELDQFLEQTSSNWKLGRMTATDRAVLRLGAFELLFTNTPDAVVINEAIELARRYGTSQSPQFVNGILDRLIRRNDQPLSGTVEKSAE